MHRAGEFDLHARRRGRRRRLPRWQVVVVGVDVMVAMVAMVEFSTAHQRAGRRRPLPLVPVAVVFNQGQLHVCVLV